MLKKVKISLESHIVLDCDTDIILTVLSQAEDVGLMDDYHSFIITSLVSKKKKTTIFNYIKTYAVCTLYDCNRFFHS